MIVCCCHQMCLLTTNCSVQKKNRRQTRKQILENDCKLLKSRKQEVKAYIIIASLWIEELKTPKGSWRKPLLPIVKAINIKQYYGTLVNVETLC